jgi:hypothetical protein
MDTTIIIILILLCCCCCCFSSFSVGITYYYASDLGVVTPTCPIGLTSTSIPGECNICGDNLPESDSNPLPQVEYCIADPYCPQGWQLSNDAQYCLYINKLNGKVSSEN